MTFPFEPDGPTDQRVKTLRYVAARLRGIELVVGSSKKDDISVMALALMSCPEHQGVHHFAVVGEGREIAVTTTGYECLKEQGFEL